MNGGALNGAVVPARSSSLAVYRTCFSLVTNGIWFDKIPG
jgi:hypothetical protein